MAFIGLNFSVRCPHSTMCKSVLAEHKKAPTKTSVLVGVNEENS